MSKRKLVQPTRERNLTAEQIPQQLLIKTLDCRQDCQLKFKILGQETLRERDSPCRLGEFFTTVQSKDECYCRRKLLAARHCFAPASAFPKCMDFRARAASGNFGLTLFAQLVGRIAGIPLPVALRPGPEAPFPGRRRSYFLSCFRISRAAFAPEPPVNPAPGCVPLPQR